MTTFHMTMIDHRGVVAAATFKADVNWLALNLNQVEEAKTFRFGTLIDLRMEVGSGAFSYRPPPPEQGLCARITRAMKRVFS